jgi:hypothetical protein
VGQAQNNLKVLKSFHYCSVMTAIKQPMRQQPSLLRRALLGALVGALLGALELWFLEFDLSHFWAAAGAGAAFMSILAIVAGQLQPRGFKLFLVCGVAGSIAGMVCWVIANQIAEGLWVAVCVGMILGVLYVWMEEIVPFKCEKCGTEFDLNDGGLCSVCKRFFCSSHLDEIKVGKSRNLICSDCKKAQEKVC